MKRILKLGLIFVLLLILSFTIEDTLFKILFVSIPMVVVLIIEFKNMSKSGELKSISIFSSGYKEQIESLELQVKELQATLDTTGYPKCEQLQDQISRKEATIIQLDKDISSKRFELSKSDSRLSELHVQEIDAQNKIDAQIRRLKKIKELISSVNYGIKAYYSDNLSEFEKVDLEQVNELAPSIILKLHHMDIKDLKKAFRDNDNIIKKTLKQYESRYTTKANRTIYQLLVIALRAELQNILYNLKYEKLDRSIEQLKSMTSKYLQIAGDGNQAIFPTLVRFIGELEYLFTNSVKIEYNYYVKKEQQKQEQAALREQMRQEAEERKALEAEKKKIEQEEQKYNAEIEKLKATAATTTDSKELEILNARILELQAQLSDVQLKKDDITKLQNGKAGNVYIISNLGSFGDDVFKIGMTRRLEPQDRVNELGSASVPFKFDVHSFIFSEDAVALESSLHQRLNSNRVNKVNLRKEFFRVSIDELEKLVNEIDPTAAFSKTMVAEEYNQSLSTSEIYDSSEQNVYSDDDDIDE